MNLTAERKNDIVVVHVNDDINFENTRDLKTFIQKQIDEEHVSKFIINLEAVNFIDSSGLGTLVSVFTLLKKMNGFLKISGINENIDELFKLTRLNDFFEIYDNVDLALESFNK